MIKVAKLVGRFDSWLWGKMWSKRDFDPKPESKDTQVGTIHTAYQWLLHKYQKKSDLVPKYLSGKGRLDEG